MQEFEAGFTVFCTGAQVLSGETFGHVTGPLYSCTPYCIGTEQQLSECPCIETNNCTEEEKITISCSGVNIQTVHMYALNHCSFDVCLAGTVCCVANLYVTKFCA